MPLFLSIVANTFEAFKNFSSIPSFDARFKPYLLSFTEAIALLGLDRVPPFFALELALGLSVSSTIRDMRRGFFNFKVYRSFSPPETPRVDFGER